MTLVFFWTGLVIWTSIALLSALVVVALTLQFTLATIEVLMQELWVKRAGIKRNDVSFWRIVLQEASFHNASGLCKQIALYARRAKNRYVPPQTGFLNIPGK